MKPSYNELEAKLLETETKLLEAESKLLEMQKLLKLALERIAALEEQLGKNSKNSSTPPSRDRKANSKDREDKNRKSRSGIARPLFTADQIDHFHDCLLENCPHCGSSHLIDQNEPYILQQVELPEVKATVTQFNRIKYGCSSCGETSFGSLPNGIPHSAFGPRLMSLTATLTGVFHLAKRDAVQPAAPARLFFSLEPFFSSFFEIFCKKRSNTALLDSCFCYMYLFNSV
ncbi:MAG: IS66 family transposase zinc-finger binding domain-containing protein [Verrucomicrobia bacterium]|nr:IS66 family transposase zinc-finger binding domain-containing protein [Verrucomicrobiota bacterium]